MRSSHWSPGTGVLPRLRQIVDGDSPAGYLDHLEDLPLGPNVVSLLGHSAIRAHVMGFGRSVDDHVTPTAGEVATMGAMVDQALDAGYLGLSSNTLTWYQCDGDRYRSRTTTSVLAK